MPELPEVYGFQQYIEATCLDQVILEMDCTDPARLLRQPLARFEEALIGKRFTHTTRIGKYLFVHTDGEFVLVMHFGMTGKPHYYDASAPRPRFGHIRLVFDSGYHFAFENMRKFGWWDLTTSVDSYQLAHKLNVDARDLSRADFKAAVSSRKTAIKNVLMNQSITTGVGNWIADDVLYQARVHPLRLPSSLSESELDLLYDKLQHVIDVAIDKDTQYTTFPDYFLIHNRKGREYCHHTGDCLEKIKVGGRTTYFSPNWQR